MNMEDKDNGLLSKTQVKKEMDALQDLGMRLVKLSGDTLKKTQINSELIEAVMAYQKITSNGATKRQAQYIGRVMRELEDDEVQIIEDYLSLLDGENKAHNALMQRLERLREQLLSDDDVLTDFLNQHPEANSSELRTLIRNARKEKEAQKPPKAYRALFRYLKELKS